MEEQYIARLIKKYRAGSCTPLELQELETWWANALEDDRYKVEVSEFERELLKQKMLRNIQAEIRRAPGRATSWNFIPDKSGYSRLLAACLAFIVVSSIVLFSIFQSDEVLIASQFGERREVILPDQSVVVLNGNSSIRYATWGNNEDRHVWLEGEAFFAVKHTENHNRFIVHTPDSTMVEVLGTQFTVHNRTGETHVVLREGKVKLNKASQTYIMKPNEMVRYSSIHREFVTTLVDAEQKISWKDNILIFQDETLQTVADRLEASHGLRIFFKNETVSKEIFNGSIPGDSVEVLFEKIEKLYGLSVTQNDSRTYTIE